MQQLAGHAELGRDAHRAGHAGLGDHVGRLFRRQRGHVVVDLGGRDHWRAHQRHVDGREGHADVGELAGRTARPGVQRRLAGHIGAEARRVRQHADRADVDHMPLAFGHHARQQAHGHAQAAEVVQLHRAFEIMEAVVAAFDRAADGAAGVVDQEVDAAEIRRAPFDERRAAGLIGDVAGKGVDLRLLAGLVLDLGHRLIELGLVAGADQRDRAGFRELDRRRQADARGAAGHQHHLAAGRALERAVDEEVGVEVALPVVPQPPGVVVQVGAGDARALERGLGVTAVEARRVVDEGEQVLGQAEVLHHRIADAAHRRQRHQALLDALRDEAHQRRVDEEVHLGRVRGLAEDVQHIANAVALRVDEVVAALALADLVRDVVQRVDDEVHRHDVDAPALQPDAGHPRRQDLAHALDQLEEVVRPVDLVHLAGGRVTDDHGRAVHRPRPLALLAHDLFALVLGHEVGVIEVLGLVEHVLAEHAFVEARRGDRTHVMHMAGLDGLRKLDHAARALDVDGHLRLFIGREVVDRGEVVEVVDLALEAFDHVGRHTQLLAGEVPVDRDRAGLGDPPEGQQLGQLGRAFLAHQEVDRAAAPCQQLLDEAFADEACGTGDEILHAGLLLVDLDGVAAILHHRRNRPAGHFPEAPARPRDRARSLGIAASKPDAAATVPLAICTIERTTHGQEAPEDG
mmetsp:Transcript_13045/g.52044  ORF Transcript_13045/g.52044 Transcript_13045/m.52044 type:complete len:688 (-) Transcript_13045:2028-4091(-)